MRGRARRASSPRTLAWIRITCANIFGIAAACCMPPAPATYPGSAPGVSTGVLCRRCVSTRISSSRALSVACSQRTGAVGVNANTTIQRTREYINILCIRVHTRTVHRVTSKYGSYNACAPAAGAFDPVTRVAVAPPSPVLCPRPCGARALCSHRLPCLGPQQGWRVRRALCSHRLPCLGPQQGWRVRHAACALPGGSCRPDRSGGGSH